MTKQERYKKSHRWVRFVEWARRRCSDPKSRAYSWYGGRGIRCELLAADAKLLWERDGAAKMARPSLDRIDVDGNYTLENCRFIEFVENRRRQDVERGLPAVSTAVYT